MTELEFTEAVVGLRPATADNAPLLGRIDDRTVVATGHYRNGILLAPLTADLWWSCSPRGAHPSSPSPSHRIGSR